MFTATIYRVYIGLGSRVISLVSPPDVLSLCPLIPVVYLPCLPFSSLFITSEIINLILIGHSMATWGSLSLIAIRVVKLCKSDIVDIYKIPIHVCKLHIHWFIHLILIKLSFIILLHQSSIYSFFGYTIMYIRVDQIMCILPPIIVTTKLMVTVNEITREFRLHFL